MGSWSDVCKCLCRASARAGASASVGASASLDVPSVVPSTPVKDNTSSDDDDSEDDSGSGSGSGGCRGSGGCSGSARNSASASAMASEDNPLGSTGSESFAENITLPDTAPVDGPSFALSEEDALSLLSELIDLNPSGLIDDESLLLADLSDSTSSDQLATEYAVEATGLVADLSAGDHYDDIVQNDILVGMSELG